MPVSCTINSITESAFVFVGLTSPIVPPLAVVRQLPFDFLAESGSTKIFCISLVIANSILDFPL